MREIKFRAWHKTEKVMCPIETLTNRGAFCLGVKKGEDNINIDLRIIIPAPDNGRFCEFDDIELMQFTGLKDKNGKEIYEGDILGCYFSAPWDNEIPVYEKGVVTKDDPFLGCFCYKSPIDNTCFLYELHQLEVVGNIYENPELI